MELRVPVHGNHWIMWLVAIAALAVCVAAFLTGPPTFDAVDGAEFAVVGMRVEICHSPGYPLFIWLVRTAGMVFGGFDYIILRILSSFLAGLCVLTCFFALKALGTGGRGSLLGSLLFITLTPVFSQMNILEVHSLAVLLLLIAIAVMRTRLVTYGMGMALFAGHPTSLVLLPMVVGKRFRTWLILLALIPATIWIYVPLRESAASVMHYSHPDTPARFLTYLRMYSANLQLPQVAGIISSIKAIGIPGVLTILVGMAFAGRPSWRYVTAVCVSMVLLASYAVGDISSLSWLFYLPLCAWSSRGLQRLSSRRWGAVLSVLLVSVSAVSGVYRARRNDDTVADAMSRDVFGSLPAQAVLCTTGQQSFYAAYLTQIDDRRPDLILMNTFGNQFGLRLRSPFPGNLGGRPLYATRGWNEPELRLKGIVFAPSSDTLPVNWNRFRLFLEEGYIYDGYSRDVMAEMWLRRTLQTANPALADSFACEALEWASTDMARQRIEQVLFVHRR